MKILCLNYRGLGWPEAVRELRSLCELHRSWLVFLSETRYFSNNVDGLVRTLNMSGDMALAVSAGGQPSTLVDPRCRGET